MHDFWILNNRKNGPMRQMPSTQHPHAHRQQILSLPPHHQHLHPMQHPVLSNPRMLIGVTSQNPNGKSG